ncbi:hypothetical protein E2C01_073805 [Portunus trituberculatus]|uniref:Uncharacterized protein n=1 Tax=Portunus trituberculatus TaxID=210409 RepID=A0A5B7ICM5_PORTR|nr:hypothetical protein [Portunus trituberculatus]
MRLVYRERRPLPPLPPPPPLPPSLSPPPPLSPPPSLLRKLTTHDCFFRVLGEPRKSMWVIKIVKSLAIDLKTSTDPS